MIAPSTNVGVQNSIGDQGPRCQSWYCPGISSAWLDDVGVPPRREFGDFLRSRRERLDPSVLRRQDGRRRRTPGLRREEIAELAGIGVDWYIRLEQGRAVNPSDATLAALAVALQLNASEHHHLLTLARPTTRARFVREVVPDSMREMLGALEQPAYLIGRRFDVLAWNRAATELLTDFALLDEPDRNTVSIMMTNPSSKRAFGAGWRAEAQRVVARFRAAYDLDEGDPAFVELIDRVSTSSPLFREWWANHDVDTSTSGVKTISSGRRAPQTWAHHSFQSNDDPNLRLVIYSRQAG